MPEKTELSEEQLDEISGGVFTYQGKKVKRFEKINDFGVQIDTKDGMMFLPWNDHARETFGTTYFGTDYMKAFSAMSDRKKFKLEDFTGDPRPVNE